MIRTDLEKQHPEALRALPERLTGDGWTFFVDAKATLCAEHRWHGEYVWCETSKEWIEIPYRLWA